MHKVDNKFFVVMGGVAISGGILFALVLLLISPYKTNLATEDVSFWEKISFLNLLFFYSTLMILFTGFFSSFFFWIKTSSNSANNLYLQAVMSFRRGILMGVLICLLLVMQSLHIFIWWDALLVAGMIILLEMYLMVK
jgi:hypothetical protein